MSKESKPHDRGDQRPDVRVFADAADRMASRIDLFLRGLRPDMGLAAREQMAREIADDLFRTITPDFPDHLPSDSNA